MEKISINISDELAEKWAKTSPLQKNKIEKYLENSVRVLLFRLNDEKFDKLLEKVRDETESKGLTNEILEELLNEG